jgi:hypothetical protein
MIRLADVRPGDTVGIYHSKQNDWVLAERVPVAKVGRVRITIEHNGWESQYRIDGGWPCAQNSIGVRLMTDDEHADYVERARLRTVLRERHRATIGDVSTETLTAVLALLDADRAARP